ncbi:MAG: hypothetical protein E7423_08870 [Ruminococcaceae bacterium]|jgi:hypothetical protein|nr:hypothetical protein [Oscillospiraceae bacterium]
MNMKKRALTSLALAAGILLLFAATALAVDLDRTVAVTVNAGGQDFYEDLQNAHVVVDLYKIADAEAAGDALTFVPAAPYANLQLPANPDSSTWSALAQTCAQMALELDRPVVEGAETFETITGDRLSAGLYLILARGADEENPVRRTQTPEGEDAIVTTAHSESYSYTFNPELIAVPYRASELDEWSYAPTITLKPARELREKPLEIVKRLENYRPEGPAVFVFSVKAVKDGVTVFDNVVTTSFTEAGEKSLLVGVPIGSEVTVTEVYSGAGYKPVGRTAQHVTITLDEDAVVTFVNDVDGSTTTGGGIENHFEYDNADSWGWTKIEQEG